jgi:hypothetical protein
VKLEEIYLYIRPDTRKEPALPEREPPSTAPSFTQTQNPQPPLPSCLVAPYILEASDLEKVV